MNRIFFTVVYSLVLQNFLWNEVFADSGFSNDFIEQAKGLGINIGQDLDKPEVKLPEPPKQDAKPDVKLPELPKQDAKPDVKLPEPPKQNAKQRKLPKKQVGAKLNKNLKDKKISSNKKQQVLKKSNNIKDEDKLVNAIKQPKTTTSKMIPKKKSDKSISYFIAPEKNIDNNFNPKSFMRRKPYNYDIKPPQYLLDIQKKGAKTNIPKFMFKDELSKLLFVAVNDQNIGAIKGLLLKGGNINVQNKANEYTPLMYAVENSKLDSLRYLILRGANPNIITSNKMSALHLAAITSNLKALRILLNADSNIFIQDKYYKTFFDYVEPNYKNIVISDIFDTRKDASVALMDFCILGSLEGVKYSLQNKANINSQNHNGDTPLILAVRHNNSQLVTYLLSMGGMKQ